MFKKLWKSFEKFVVAHPVGVYSTFSVVFTVGAILEYLKGNMLLVFAMSFFAVTDLSIALRELKKKRKNKNATN